MSARRFVSRLVVVVGVVMALWSVPALASLGHPFVSSFGSFASVQGLANDASGDVYVYDGGAGKVFKYTATGEPAEFSLPKANEITVGGVGGGEGEIAIDSSSGPAKGDIYVAHGDGNVEIYSAAGEKIGALNEEAGKPWGEACGVAVDSSGNVYVGLYGKHVNKYVPAANPVADADYSGSLWEVSNVCNVAADSAGGVYVDSWSAGPVTRYEASQFNVLETPAIGQRVDAQGSTLAVDQASDHVYVDEGSQVAEFGADGEPLEEPVGTFAGTGGGAISGSVGVTVNGASKDIYVSDGKGGLSVYGPGVLLPTVVTGEPSNIAVNGMTLNGSVNPEGVSVTSCVFEYGATTAYGASAPCTTSPGTGNAPVAVTAVVTGLQPGTEYHYRIVASNANGESQGSDQVLTTGAPPTIEDESVVDASGSDATLQATIDPMGWQTTYHLEYGTNESYGASIPVSDAELGATVGQQTVSLHVQNLQLATVYHYRFVAADGFGVADGGDQTFITQPAGGKVNLLDGRQWEVVSPQQKHGAQIEPTPFEGGGAIESSEDGTALAYLANSPIDASPPANRGPEPVQILATRTGESWDDRTISTPHAQIEGGTVQGIGKGAEYRLFSPDLARAAVEPRGATPLAAGVTERTQYVRNNDTCDTTPSTCYTPLVTAANAQPGIKWGGEDAESKAEVRFLGASPDLTHVVVQSRVQLTADGGGPGLYEWSGGQLQPVSVSPEDEGGTMIGGYLGAKGIFGVSGVVRNAISSDGSRVVWSSESNLYMRDMLKKETIKLNSGAAGSGVPVFDTASADGSRVFFADGGSESEEGDLYECHMVESAGKLKCVLTDVTNARFEGQVLGVSDDSSYVYFVSNNVLAAGASPGKCLSEFGTSETCNLYVAHRTGTEWSFKFIAILSVEDGKTWSQSGFYGTNFAGITSRVSPNGKYVAFMSDRKLTGYDNRDVNSGARDEEVFLYGVEKEELHCVSCDPTGARPKGVFEVSQFAYKSLLVDPSNAWQQRWLAGNVPTWEPIDANRGVYQPRYLSDSGRMFFDSSDGLVPQDTNGLEDAYEYEPVGIGSCLHAGGCVQLISSGTSKEESAFLDASANGDDVFILTAGQLSSQDQDSAVDVYDAHVCTASVPCSENPASSPPCDTSDSCKAAPTPQPALFGTPSSETFSGSGNVVHQAPEQPAVKSAGLTRAQKLARALKACAKRHGVKARARCRVRARKRFAAKASSRHTKQSGSARTKRVAGKSTHAGRGR